MNADNYISLFDIIVNIKISILHYKPKKETNQKPLIPSPINML